jgi:hypothetical protein
MGRWEYIKESSTKIFKTIYLIILLKGSISLKDLELS